MNRTLLAALVATLALGAVATDAYARSRSVNGTGAGGHSYSRQLQSGCADQTCSRSRSGTTRNGNSWGHSGSVTNNGNGTWSGQRSGTGTHGGSYSSQGSVTNNGNGTYTYNGTGTATGPNGGSVSRDKTVTVTPAN